jgi:hypothetical protein
MTLPVMVLFPDTLCEVTCQENATEAQPVLTGNLQAQIILGNTSLSLSNLVTATTRVYFSNVDLHPFLNPQTPQAIAYFEASNFPGKPQSFIPKPAGELRGWWSVPLNSGGNFVDLIHGGQPIGAGTDIFQWFGFTHSVSSYIVITDIKAYITGMYMDSVGGSYAYDGAQLQLTIGNLLSWNIFIRKSMAEYNYKLLQDSHGLFLQLNPYSTTVSWGKTFVVGTGVYPSVAGMFYLDIQFSYINTI